MKFLLIVSLIRLVIEAVGKKKNKDGGSEKGETILTSPHPAEFVLRRAIFYRGGMWEFGWSVD